METLRIPPRGFLYAVVARMRFTVQPCRGPEGVCGAEHVHWIFVSGIAIGCVAGGFGHYLAFVFLAFARTAKGTLLCRSASS